MEFEMKRVNYLNNNDLLLEIHKSKSSYSVFTDPSYHQYDIIVETFSDVNDDSIEQAKYNRAKRILQQETNSVRISKDNIDVDSVLTSDLIFRVMSYDHIPNALSRKKTPKQESDTKEKVNFLPFQHWKFTVDNVFICVGKSHWTGELHTGEFSATAGQITDRLALMYMKFSEQCSKHRWYCGYSYLDEMKLQALAQLIQVGLKFNEHKSDNPFAYLSSIVFNSFKRIKDIEKQHQALRDDLLQANGFNPSYTRINAGLEADYGYSLGGE